MSFAIIDPGTVPPPPPVRPRLPRPGRVRRGWTSPGVYEPVEEVTEDGEWALRRSGDGTWAAVHQPNETVVKAGLRSRGACRAYTGSVKAREDLERMQAESKENANGE